MRTTVVTFWVVMAVMVAITGCAAGPAAKRADSAQALGSVAEAVDQASSAVATTSAALTLWQDGKLPAVTTDAAVADATSAIDSAAHELTTIVVPDPRVLALRNEALSAVQDATVTIAATRTWVGGKLSTQRGEHLTDQLQRSSDDLDEIGELVHDGQAGKVWKQR